MAIPHPMHTKEEVLAIRPWAIFFPGDPLPNNQVILYRPYPGKREKPQSPRNGLYYVVVGMATTLAGWWLCNQVESPENPRRRLYRVDPHARARLGLNSQAQYTMADIPPVQPGSWYYSQEDYRKPVEVVLYPPDLEPIKHQRINALQIPSK